MSKTGNELIATLMAPTPPAGPPPDYGYALCERCDGEFRVGEATAFNIEMGFEILCRPCTVAEPKREPYDAWAQANSIGVAQAMLLKPLPRDTPEALAKAREILRRAGLDVPA